MWDKVANERLRAGETVDAPSAPQPPDLEYYRPPSEAEIPPSPVKHPAQIGDELITVGPPTWLPTSPNTMWQLVSRADIAKLPGVPAKALTTFRLVETTLDEKTGMMEPLPPPETGRVPYRSPPVLKEGQRTAMCPFCRMCYIFPRGSVLVCPNCSRDLSKESQEPEVATVNEELTPKGGASSPGGRGLHVAPGSAVVQAPILTPREVPGAIDELYGILRREDSTESSDSGSEEEKYVPVALLHRETSFEERQQILAKVAKKKGISKRDCWLVDNFIAGHAPCFRDLPHQDGKGKIADGSFWHHDEVFQAFPSFYRAVQNPELMGLVAENPTTKFLKEILDERELPGVLDAHPYLKAANYLWDVRPGGLPRFQIESTAELVVTTAGEILNRTKFEHSCQRKGSGGGRRELHGNWILFHCWDDLRDEYGISSDNPAIVDVSAPIIQIQPAHDRHRKREFTVVVVIIVLIDHRQVVRQRGRILAQEPKGTFLWTPGYSDGDFGSFSVGGETLWFNEGFRDQKRSKYFKGVGCEFVFDKLDRNWENNPDIDAPPECLWYPHEKPKRSG